MLTLAVPTVFLALHIGLFHASEKDAPETESSPTTAAPKLAETSSSAAQPMPSVAGRATPAPTPVTVPPVASPAPVASSQNALAATLRRLSTTVESIESALGSSATGAQLFERRSLLSTRFKYSELLLTETVERDAQGQEHITSASAVVASHLLVRRSAGSDWDTFAAQARQADHRLVASDGNGLWWRLETTGPVTLATLEQLSGFVAQQSTSVYAEPDAVVAASQLKTEPLQHEQWTLASGKPFDFAQTSALAAVESPLVAVAVIDSGVDATHPDLQQGLWINVSEIPDNGIDDDANGYVDDVQGWDFLEDDPLPLDAFGHGTHVAGILAAARDNELGVAGIVPQAAVVPLRFLDANGLGVLSDAVRAVRYATLKGIPIINASWGGPQSSLQLQEALIEYQGLVVASAGNDARSLSAAPVYPAAYAIDNVLAVAATDTAGGLAAFSNYGVSQVDLAAPGRDIFSTLPQDRYGTMSGTSMAAAHVSAAATLFLAQRPDLDGNALALAVLGATESTPALSEYVSAGASFSVEGVTPSLALLPAPAQHVAADTVLFNVDMGTPPHTVNQLLRVGAPAGPSRINFGDPYVRSSLGALLAQPLEMQGGQSACCGLYEQLEFALLSFADASYLVSFDVYFETHPTVFKLLFDSPTVRNLYWQANGSIRGSNLNISTPPGTFEPRRTYRYDIYYSQGEVRLWQDGELLGSAPFSWQQARSLRLHQSHPTTSARTGVDNFRIVANPSSIEPGTPAPELHVSPDALDFGNVFLGLDNTLPLTLQNLGFGSIEVGAPQIEGDGFTLLEGAALTLGPNASDDWTIRFAPEQTGTSSGSLTFDYVAGDTSGEMTIVLSGFSAEAIEFELAPASVTQALGVGQTVTRTVTLTNQTPFAVPFTLGIEAADTVESCVLQRSATFGGSEPLGDETLTNGEKSQTLESDLHVYRQVRLAEVEGFGGDWSAANASEAPALEDVREALNLGFASINGLIPNRFNFSDGVSGTSISDGGSDMFDGGNSLRTDRGGPLSYQNAAIVENNWLGPDGRYFTRKFPGLFVFAGDISELEEFRITGNLGADGSGSAEASVLEVRRGGVRYLGFFKRVFDARDPSVNQLILIRDNGLAEQTIATHTNDGLQQLENLEGVNRIYYMLFASQSGGRVSDDEALAIMEQFLEVIGEGGGLVTVEPTDLVLGPNQSTELELNFNAGAFDPGVYAYRLRAGTTLDGRVERVIPITATVLPPEVQVEPQRIALHALQGLLPEVGASLRIEPTQLGATVDWAITESPEWLEVSALSGTAAQTIELSVSQVFTQPVFLRGEVRLETQGTTVLIPVSLQVDSLNLVQLDADLKRGWIYGINRSTVDDGTDLLVRIDAEAEAVIDSLALGEEMTDIAFDPEWAYAFAISYAQKRIYKIDLDAFRVVSSRQIETLGDHVLRLRRYDVEVGPDGILYYTDNVWGPKLYAFDYESGEVLEDYSFNGTGDVLRAADGESLFTWKDYRGNAGSWVTRIESDPDGQLREMDRSTARDSREPEDAPLLLTLDGQTLFVKEFRYDANNLSIHKDLVPESDSLFSGHAIYAISLYGDLVFSNSNIRDGYTGAIVGSLPVRSSRAMALDTFQTKVVQFDPGQQALLYTDLTEFNLPGLLPQPQTGGGNPIAPGAPLDELVWTTHPMVERYGVYLSTQHGEVLHGSMHGPAFMGMTAGGRLQLPIELTRGQQYFWRVDAYLPDGSILPGEVWEYRPPAMFVETPEVVLQVALGFDMTFEDTIRFGGELTGDWSFAQPDFEWLRVSRDPSDPLASPIFHVSPQNHLIGRHASYVDLTLSGETVRVPVKLEVYNFEADQLFWGPGEQEILAYHWGSQNRDFYDAIVVHYDVSSEVVTRASRISDHGRLAYMAADPAQLLILNGSGVFQLNTYDLASQSLQPPRIPPLTIRDIFGGSSSRLYGFNDTFPLSAITILDREDLSLEQSIESPFTGIRRGYFSELNQALYVTGYFGSFYRYELVDDALEITAVLEADQRHSLPWVESSNGEWFGCGSVVVDAALTQTQSVPYEVSSLSPEGSLALLTHYDGLELYDLLNEVLITRISTVRDPLSLFSSDGNTAYAWSERGVPQLPERIEILPPQIVLPESPVDFGPVIQGATPDYSLLIQNLGHYALELSEIEVIGGGFALGEVTTDVVVGIREMPLPIAFSTDTLGIFEGQLRIVSNDPEQPEVVLELRAEVIPPPVLSVSDDALAVEVPAYGSVTRTLTLRNDGGSTLDWAIAVRNGDSAGASIEAVSLLTEEGPLERTLENLNENFENITNLIPNRYDFRDGVTGSQISDGGNDMFDGGNRISTNLRPSDLNYSNNAIVEAPEYFGEGGRYFTRKYPGLFVLSAQMQGVSSFRILGNLGADGRGNAEGSVLEAHIGGIHYRGFFKRVFNAGDPSVNQLIIVSDNSAAYQQFSTHTNNGYQEVFNLQETEQIHYLLFASGSGGRVSDAQALAIMEAYVNEAGSSNLAVVEPPFGSLAPGELIEVTVTITSPDPEAGVYTGDLLVLSNDPETPERTVSITATVPSAPYLSVAPTELNFDPIFVGDTSVQTVEITNLGNALLGVMPQAGSDPSFGSLGINGLVVEPAQTVTMEVAFTPNRVGPIAGTLELVSNAMAQGSVFLNLSGEGLVPPAFELAGLPVTVEVPPFGMAEHVVTVSNTGGSPLEWSLAIEENTTVSSEPTIQSAERLQTVLDNLNANHIAITALIPNRFNFRDGVFGTSIIDGGGDMFDGGNILNTPLFNNLAYRDNQVTDSTAFGPAGAYFTRKVPGLFVLGAQLDNIDYFRITGNLGADGGGQAEASVLEVTSRGRLYQGFFKRVFNAGDPSVNQLVIIPHNPEATQTVNFNTNDGLQQVDNLQNTIELYYLLFASSNGGRVSDAQALQIMQAFLDASQVPAWIDPSLSAGTVAPGASMDVTLTLSPPPGQAGSFEALLRFLTNDPQHREVSYPLTIEVPSQPSIQVDRESIDFGTLFENDQAAEILTLTNVGNDTLWVTALPVDSPGFSLRTNAPFNIAPGNSREVSVRFQPSEPGEYSATLRILSNDDDNSPLLVRLEGIGVSAPVAAVTPPSLSLEMLSGEVATRTLTVSNLGTPDSRLAFAFLASSQDTPTPGISDDATLGGGSLFATIPPPVDVYDASTDVSPVGPFQPAPGVERPLSPGDVIGARIFTVERAGLVNQVQERDPVTGSIINTVALPDSISGGPDGLAFDGDSFYYVNNFGSSRVYQFDAVTGEIQRQFSAPGLDALATDGDVLYALAYSSDQIQVIDIESGSVLRRLTPSVGLGGGISYAGDRGTLFVSNFSSRIYEIDPLDGTVLNEFSPPTTIYGLGYSVGAGVLFSSAPGGTNYALNPETGEILHQFSGGNGSCLASDEAGGSRQIGVSFDEGTGTLSGGAQQSVDVTFNAENADGGEYQLNLTVATNDPLRPEIVVPVTVEITGAPALSLDPVQIDFEPLFVGLTAEAQLEVRNTGNDTLLLSDFSVQGAGFSMDLSSDARIEVAPRRTASLNVHFAPGNVGAVEGTLTFSSNSALQPMVSVPLSGEGLSPPVAVISPTTFNLLGPVGVSHDVTLTVANQGGSPLNWAASRQTVNVTTDTSVGASAHVPQHPLRSPDLTALSEPAQLLVRFRADALKADTVAALSAVGASVVREYRLVPGLQLVRIPPSLQIADAIQALGNDPRVLYAEPDYIVSLPEAVQTPASTFNAASAFPNDPSFDDLWGLHNTGQQNGVVDADIDAPEAWSLYTGDPSVVIGVIDSGVDINHPDLANNIWRNPLEIPGNNIDDDDNGYVDDVYGWDFVNNDNNPFDGHSHGTHVAGTIAAEGNNGVGVTGVSWRASIMTLKALSDLGSGSTSNLIAAIEYATEMNCFATNNSWGGGSFSNAMLEAISRANEAGQLFVAAAGNTSTNNDSSPHYPSSYDVPNIIAVASTDASDRLSSFSSYGSTTVDIGAPGSSILSTEPNNRYGFKSGTSMASPHVSGAVALLKAYNPNLTAAEIKTVLMESADPISSLQDRVLSRGRLNLYAALQLSGPAWIALNPVGGAVAPGQSTDVSVQLDTANFTPGEVRSVVIAFTSNDPANPVIEVYGTVTAAGAGVSSFSEAYLGFAAESFAGTASTLDATGRHHFWGPNLDYDQDGYVNLLEYFLGTDPTQHNTRGAFQLESTGSEMTFSFVALAGMEDVQYSVEFTHSLLEPWQTLPAEAIAEHHLEDTYPPQMRVEATVAMDDAPQGAFRLVIRLPQGL